MSGCFISCRIKGKRIGNRVEKIRIKGIIPAYGSWIAILVCIARYTIYDIRTFVIKEIRHFNAEDIP